MLLYHYAVIKTFLSLYVFITSLSIFVHTLRPTVISELLPTTELRATTNETRRNIENVVII